MNNTPPIFSTIKERNGFFLMKEQVLIFLSNICVTFIMRPTENSISTTCKNLANCLKRIKI